MLLSFLFFSGAAFAHQADGSQDAAAGGDSALSTPSADRGSIDGRLVTAEGEPVTEAEIDLVDLRLHTHVDENGHFAFENLPPGSYLLRVVSVAVGERTRRVAVEADRITELEVALDVIRHDDEVVVTAGIARSQLELAQTTSVLTGEDLRFRRQGTLGETLAQEPGITSTGFGQGASRPVIRGIGGDRVRMLQGGLDVGDASSTSPDHAVSTDPALAERIEVLRGPSTLLYGSSAIGGVVNVDDGSIPSHRAEQAVSGFVDLAGGTVADEKSATVSLEGGSGDWVWKIGGSLRDADDYEIPGFADVDGDEHGEDEHGDEHEEEGHDDEEHEDEEEAFGLLPNSFSETRSASFGVSRFFGDKGFVGVSFAGFDSEYGIPGGGHSHGEDEHDDDEHEEDDHGDEHEEDDHGDEHEEDDHGDEHGEDDHGDEHGEEDISIEMERRRADVRLEITEPFGPFQAFKARLGVVDYEHDEIEGDAGEVGTSFFNDTVDTRLEWIQKRRGNLSGSLGLQYFQREQEAIGEEAFLPEVDTTTWALFAFEELEYRDGDLRFQFGARYESSDVKNQAASIDRSFDGLSASVGAVWQPADGWSVALSVARSTKLPNAEELYSDGPHFATRAFEVGNPDLEEEVSTGFDLSVRRSVGRLTAELTYFRNDFDDYIYQQLTGEEEDGLDVLVFSQADAEFEGLELKARLGLWERGHRHLDLSLTGDQVEARLADGSFLPRIPPRRLSLGLHYHQAAWHGYLEVWEVDEQTDLAVLETPTDGHTLVNAGLSYRFFSGMSVYDVLLRARNLTDEEARNHVSFLKDTVPLPGRDLSLALRWTF